MSDNAMDYQDIEEEMPDLSDGGVDTFGSRVYAEGQKTEKKGGVSAKEAKAKVVEIRISEFLTRKFGEVAVRSADVAGEW